MEKDQNWTGAIQSEKVEDLKIVKKKVKKEEDKE